MEGVGARLGRSSTRYGPATVFTGPVRKWKKRWVPLAASPNSNYGNGHHHHHHHHFSSNGSSSSSSHSNGSGSSSHLLLYKWTPLAPSGNGGKDNSDPGKADDIKDGADEHPRRRYKYLPVHLLENDIKEVTEKEAAESMDEESNLADAEPGTGQLDSKDEVLDEKPDINDSPMDGNQDDNPVVRQDLNESLDLSLG